MEEVSGGKRVKKSLVKGLEKIRPEIGPLWYRGELSLLSEKKYLAVVGSRRMTDYGARALEKVLPEVISAGVVIVSGFMYGVDQAAHRLALKLGGKTIAVLGWGIDYDWGGESDKKLMGELVGTGGLVLSEYPGKKPSARYMFPQRNRIVAGLADQVLVVEAGEKSGSLLTVSWAEKFKRPVLAVPGPITSSVSRGSNQIIREGRAKMITGSEDISDSMGIIKRGVGGRGVLFFERTNSITSRIMNLLENEGLMVDEIARILREKVERVAAGLVELELNGLVTEKNGKYFSKSI